MTTYASLFCGAGLMDIPFRHPFRCVLASDSDPESCRWYERNHGLRPEVCDIRDLRPGVRAQMVLCTPPCQQFSLLNGRAAGFGDPRVRSAFSHAARACGELGPELVLLESAGGLVRRGWAGAVLDVFGSRGFRGRWRLLDSSDYGVPQRRVRAVFAFTRDGREFPWPEAWGRWAGAVDVATARTPLRESLSLQQAPAWFRLPDTAAGRRMAGNGVPLGMAAALRDSALGFFADREAAPSRDSPRAGLPTPRCGA